MNLMALARGDLVAVFHRDGTGKAIHLEGLCVLRKRLLVCLVSGLELWRVRLRLRQGLSRSIERWVSVGDRKQYLPAARCKAEEAICGPWKEAIA